MFEFTLELPTPYRVEEVLRFHGRDPQSLAESVSSTGLRKGFIARGRAVHLTIDIFPELARCRALVDGAACEATLERAARHLLGLPIDPRPFEAAVEGDRFLSPLVRQRAGLRIAQTATAFEALTWAITGQQINLPFAISLRRSLIQLGGRRHPRGGWCYPGPADVASLSPESLRACKFSQAKAEALILVAQNVASGALPLEDWHEHSPEPISSALLALKGVGPWTVNYTLLRGFAQGDCSLHGDAAVKNGLRRAMGMSEKLDNTRAEQILRVYRPHRSLAAAHFWASLGQGDGAGG